jgi:uncharacterized pyridoxamine 5'-phosphate oxidase family protein
MTEFFLMVKLFLQLYPMLKELYRSGNAKILEIKIDRDNDKIDLIFKGEQSAQEKAQSLNNIFRNK